MDHGIEEAEPISPPRSPRAPWATAPQRPPPEVIDLDPESDSEELAVAFTLGAAVHAPWSLSAAVKQEPPAPAANAHEVKEEPIAAQSIEQRQLPHAGGDEPAGDEDVPDDRISPEPAVKGEPEAVEDDGYFGLEDAPEGEYQPGVPWLFWVNQGRRGVSTIIWAPHKPGQPGSGRPWTNVLRMRPGDIILHYSKGFFRMISQVKTWPRANVRPFALFQRESSDVGYRVDSTDEVPINVAYDRIVPGLRAMNLPVGALPVQRDFKQPLQQYTTHLPLYFLAIVRHVVPPHEWPQYAYDAESLQSLESAGEAAWDPLNSPRCWLEYAEQHPRHLARICVRPQAGPAPAPAPPPEAPGGKRALRASPTPPAAPPAKRPKPAPAPAPPRASPPPRPPPALPKQPAASGSRPPPAGRARPTDFDAGSAQLLRRLAGVQARSAAHLAALLREGLSGAADLFCLLHGRPLPQEPLGAARPPPRPALRTAPGVYEFALGLCARETQRAEEEGGRAGVARLGEALRSLFSLAAACARRSAPRAPRLHEALAAREVSGWTPQQRRRAHEGVRAAVAAVETAGERLFGPYRLSDFCSLGDEAALDVAWRPDAGGEPQLVASKGKNAVTKSELTAFRLVPGRPPCLEQVRLHDDARHGHHRGVNDVAYTPDGAFILAGHEDGLLALWRAGDLSFQDSLSPPCPWCLGRAPPAQPGPPDPVPGRGCLRLEEHFAEPQVKTFGRLAVSPADPRRLATTIHGAVYAWRLVPQEGAGAAACRLGPPEALHRPAGDGDYAGEAAYFVGPDGRPRLLVGFGDGSLRLWAEEGAGGRLQPEWASSAEETAQWAAAGDPTVQSLDVWTPRAGPAAPARIAAASGDRAAVLELRCPAGGPVAVSVLGVVQTRGRRFGGPPASLWHATLSPDGALLQVATEANFAEVFAVDESGVRPLWLLDHGAPRIDNPGSVDAVEFVGLQATAWSGPRALVTGTGDGKLSLWDLAGPRPRRRAGVSREDTGKNFGAIRCVAVSPCRQWIAATIQYPAGVALYTRVEEEEAGCPVRSDGVPAYSSAQPLFSLRALSASAAPAPAPAPAPDPDPAPASIAPAAPPQPAGS